MNGEQLHGALFRHLGTRAQVVLQLRPFQPAQKAGQGALLVAVEKRGHRVVEGIQVGEAEIVGLVRGQLDIEPKFLLDQAYEVEQRQAGTGSQPGQLPAGRLYAGPPKLAESGELAVGVGGSAKKVERVDEGAALIAGDGCPQLAPQVSRDSLLRPVVRGQPSGHVGERLQVACTDAVAGAAEQAHQFAAGGGVVHHAQHTHDVGHLRCRQQPAEAEHVGAHAVCPQHLGEVVHFTARTKQHRAGMVADHTGGEPIGDGTGLLGDGLRHERLDAAGSGSDRNLERFDLDSARFGAQGLAQRDHQGVGGVEHERGVAPGEGQRHGWSRGGRAEVAGKAEQVCGAGAAPSVNGLVWIADGHHRMVPKQGVQQFGLQHGGVLVFVEEHDPVLVAIAVCDRSDFLAHLQRQRHLVGEFDQSQSAFLAAVAGGEFGQHRQRCDSCHGIDHRAIRGFLARVAIGQIGQVSETLGQALEVVRGSRSTVVPGRRVLGEGATELQHGVGDLVDALAEWHEPPVAVVDDDTPGKQPGARFAQQHRLRFTAEQQGVVREQPAGEGVVSRDARGVEQIGGLGGHLVIGVARDRHEAGRIEVGDAFVDAFAQFAGGLAGEGESENLVGAGVAVGEQPQHPVGHGLGLAATGTGDHQGGRQRRLDHGLLLGGGRRQLELSGNVEGRNRGDCRSETHELTCLMMWMRQDPWLRGSRQCEVISARKVAPPMPAASQPTRVRKASSCSGLKTGWVGLR